MSKKIPGDMSKSEKIAQMIRVNQAGEYGAKRIYQGQIALLKNDPCYEELKHMAQQEEEHLEYFNDQLIKRRVRPTLLTPIWHVAGFALGAATAFLGKKAAMACTVAVEEVIDSHYKEQLSELDEYEEEADLQNKIEKFRQEELEHRDIGIKNEADSAPFYTALTMGVKLASNAAIWLSKKI